MTKSTLRQAYTRRSPAGHWFDADSMRFFRSQIHEINDQGDNIYFVSSESPSTESERRYSVRHLKLDGNIDTVGEFCEMSHNQALTALEDAAKELV